MPQDSATTSRDHFYDLAGRVLLYLVATSALVVIAFFMGSSHFSSTHCSTPDFDGECDVAGLEGLLWSAIAFVIAIIGAVAYEWRRQRRRASADRLDNS